MFELNNVKYKDILNIKKLEINSKKITCIVGTSGSGKTTLIRLLNKLISPDSGEIIYDGTPLSEIDSVKHRRNVVMLSQDPVVFKGSIRDNLLMGQIYSSREESSDHELQKILESVDLDKNLDESPEKLSGGEKQRLAIGRVMLMDPDVLLLDEPSSALDDDTEDLVINTLVNYGRKNSKTIIMVTHSRKIAEKYSDEIVEIVKNDKGANGGYNNE